MSKKNRWLWQREQLKTAEPLKKHRVYDENGNEILDDDGYEDSYGWGIRPKEREQAERDSWGEYEKTGAWRGYNYYRPATLTYSYVQQMANIIASQHNVDVVVGNEWDVDIANKKLTYNPLSLIHMSKGELLSVLLHEIGKISLCLPPGSIKNKYIDFYDKSNIGRPAYETIAVFDDFRVDETMIRSFPSADEVYESQAGVLSGVVRAYFQKSTNYNAKVRDIVNMLLAHCEETERSNPAYTFGQIFTTASRNLGVTSNNPPNFASVQEFREWVWAFLSGEPLNIWDYHAIIVDRGYGLNTARHDKSMEERFAKTMQAVEQSVRLSSTQEVADMMNIEVFPHIEDLLMQLSQGSDDMKKGLGGSAGTISKMAASNVEGRGQAQTARLGDSSKAGNEAIPYEWTTGEYEPLRESVAEEIRSLQRKLITLRRSENVPRHSFNHRRGKLNQKTLYKHATHNPRLFKKKEIQKDTISSFAFSILVDKSGSMAGSKAVHTARGLVLLSEVFDKLNMPFEVIHFDGSAKMTKKFDEPYNKKVKGRVAHFARHDANNGGTQLTPAIESSTIKKRVENNKVMVVLTDGETGELPTELTNAYFEPNEKKGIQTIMLGLEVRDEHMRKHNNGKGRGIDNAIKMPQVFYEMIKSLIFKK